MPTMPIQFDMRRAQFLLRDLLKMTQGQAPMVEFNPSPDFAAKLRGLANRSGLLRLGLRLSLAALEADPIVSVYSDGTVTEEGTTGVLEITLTEESDLPAPESHSKILTAIFGVVVLVVVLGILVLQR
jgi:hypothetical protein